MSPVVLGSTGHPHTIVITPTLLSGDENRGIVCNAELPKYAVGLFESNGPGPRKRKRLTHLTPEEKVMRRKLKNRVAAQTARDRKKARMETLEDAVTKIHDQTKKLLDVNAQLMKRTQELEEENMILRRRLGIELSPSFMEEKCKELAIIKEEFDELSVLDPSKGALKAESSDDEGYCVLRAFDGSEVTVDEQNSADDPMSKATECRSPVPAAFGERIQERLIPQQQEAVKPAKLILSEARNKESSPLFVASTGVLSNHPKTIQTSQPSSEHWKPSILSNVLSRHYHQKKEMPLDLRIR